MGTTTDNVGVTRITWTSDRGSMGSTTGAANWTTSANALQAGVNQVTVVAWDAAGNVGSATIAITCTPAIPATRFPDKVQD